MIKLREEVCFLRLRQRKAQSFFKKMTKWRREREGEREREVVLEWRTIRLSFACVSVEMYVVV